jgi:hypothetical protein
MLLRRADDAILYAIRNVRILFADTSARSIERRMRSTGGRYLKGPPHDRSWKNPPHSDNAAAME